MTNPDVLIIGAGPTGLTLANILGQQGIPFRLVERDTAPIQQSRALWVHARTLELWDKLGVLENALERGVKFNWVELLIDGQSKGKLAYEGQGLSSHPYALVLEQNKTQAMLLAALEKHGLQPEWGVQLEGFQETDATTVVCQLKHPDGRLETVSTRYLVAADGSTSSIRQQLGLSFEGATYDSSFFLADVTMQSSLSSDRLYLNMTKQGFFAFFPLHSQDQSKRYRVIGSLNPEQTEQFERSKGIGAKASISQTEVEDYINNHSGLRIKILESRWASVYRIHRRMTNKYRVGNVFLAGDAAHIHSPAGGQGMNTGIADGFNLGWKLAAVLKGQAKQNLLESYELERLPVARDVLNKADKLFELETTQNPVLQQVKPLFIQTLSGILTRFEAGRHWLFRFLSQIGVQYRNTAFVQAHPSIAGVQAGDRLPYIALENGSTTHSIIRGLEHHLLVLDVDGLSATQRAELQTLCARYDFKLEVLVREAKLKPLSSSQTTLLLVRPDGHIAYQGLAKDLVDFEMYLQGLYLPSKKTNARIREAILVQ